MRTIPNAEKMLLGIPRDIRATVEETDEAMLLTAEFPHSALTMAIKLEWFVAEEEKVKVALREFRKEIRKATERLPLLRRKTEGPVQGGAA